MSPALEDRFGMLAAAEGRRRHRPMRFVGAGLVALGLYITFGWWQIWIWLALYYAAQIGEVACTRALLKRPPQTLIEAVLVGLVLYMPSGLIFVSLAPVLWVNGGQYGPMFAAALLTSSMINMAAVSRGSRVAFSLASVPYVVLFFALPLLDIGKAAGPMIGTAIFAAAVVLMNIMGAWAALEQAHKSEQKALAESERRRREAEAAVEAKSAFVAMICHELRTPISAILAGANELERTAANAAGRNRAQLIGHAGKMMRTLLNDLLDLSKLEAGRMSVERLPFDLRQTVVEVVRMWKPQAADKDIRLRIEGARQLPQWVMGDPTRLRQVLNNLLSNAIKFTEEGSVTVRLAAGAEAAGLRGVTIAVTDTGPGMTAKQVDRLFTPFDQLDVGTARKHGGSGLGLVISRELARLMDGDLVAASEPGKGATFTLTLSVEEAEAPAMEQAPTAVEARVLVVDDHAVNRQAIAMVLAPLGITPELAHSAEEGLERLAAEPFDLILMDVYMPGMCGREATRQLRNSPGPNRETPVIAITASATPQDWDACLAAGMNGYVGKPIEPAQLYAVLEQVMSGAAFEAEAA